MDNIELIDDIEFDSNAQKKLPNETVIYALGILSILPCSFGIILSIIVFILHKKDKQLYIDSPVNYGDSYKKVKTGKICAQFTLIKFIFSIILTTVIILINLKL